MRTIRDILALSVEERKNLYSVTSANKRIHIVKIDGIEFTEYSAFTFLREKSYAKSPERSADGTIDNLNAYSTFTTPHLKIDFSLLSIDSYRTLMKLIYSKNEFLVTCYDVVKDAIVTERMYFATEDMPKLAIIQRALGGDEWAELIGVIDYTVELVGTNVSTENVTINYYLNSPTGAGQTTPIGGEEVALGGDFVVGDGVKIDEIDGYAFYGWKIGNAENGVYFSNGSVATVNSSILNKDSNSVNIYAQWYDTQDYVLSFAYGIAKMQATTQLTEFTSTLVRKGYKIGSLPEIVAPSVKYNNEEYVGVYTPLGWYKLPTPQSERVDAATLYWKDGSSTIYALFETRKYSLTLFFNDEENGSPKEMSTTKIAYGETFVLPQYFKDGETFDGWYIDRDYTKKSTYTNMPPYSINLFARWAKKE